MKKIYIVHGWTYKLDKWQNFLQSAKPAGIDPVMLHVPGLTTDDERVFGMDDYVAWLHRALQKEKGERIVLAHSNGGRIALHYLAKYPTGIDKLILIDSAGTQPSYAQLKKRQIFAQTAQLAKKLKVNAKFLSVAYKFIRATDYINAPANMKITMQNMLDADKDFNDKIATIDTPSLLIWGRDDSLTPLASGETLAGLLETELHVIDGARHAPFDTHTDKVINLVKGFIK